MVLLIFSLIYIIPKLIFWYFSWGCNAWYSKIHDFYVRCQSSFIYLLRNPFAVFSSRCKKKNQQLYKEINHHLRY